MPKSSLDRANALFLSGEVHGLYTFAHVLAQTCPNPELVLSHFGVAEQAGLARIETIATGDELVEGYQFVMDGLRKSLEDAAAAARAPRKS